jgi:hypothetical protein
MTLISWLGPTPRTFPKFMDLPLILFSSYGAGFPLGCRVRDRAMVTAIFALENMGEWSCRLTDFEKPFS